MSKIARTLAALAAATILGTSVAKAADPIESFPDAPLADPALEPSWTGFYIGGGGGFNMLSADHKGMGELETGEDFYVPGYGIISSGRFDNDAGEWGGFGTVEAGADYQMDQFVLGVVGGYDFGTTKAKSSSSSNCSSYDGAGPTADPCYAFTDGEVEVGDAWFIGGRVGYLATPSTLLFAAAGYTQADISHGVYHEQGDGAGGFEWVSTGDSEWKDGYYVGGGVEQMFGENFSLKAEYRFADYGSSKVDYSFFEGLGPQDAAGGAESSVDVYNQSVRLTAAWRF